MKGYKLYDLNLHIVFVSRDVVFHENIFPFALKNPPSANDSVLPLPVPMHESTIPLLDPLLSNSSPTSPSNQNSTSEPAYHLLWICYLQNHLYLNLAESLLG